MAKYRKHVRVDLLALMQENPDSEWEFSARFLARKNEAWITVSQLCKKDSKDILASHLNLPIHKLNVDDQTVKTYQKGKFLSIKATITTYKSGGVLRAALAGVGSDNKIEISQG